MALKNCPDCGKGISSLATMCPNCGYPMASQSDRGYVKIKIPVHFEGVKDRLFFKRKVTISVGASWVGEYGDTARFEVEGPTKIWIDMGMSVGLFDAVVYPNCSYRIESYLDRWGIAQFDLVEI